MNLQQQAAGYQTSKVIVIPRLDRGIQPVSAKAGNYQ